MAADTSSLMKSAAGRTQRLLWAILVVLALLYLFSGIYSVAPNELGVHLRFGKMLTAKVPPGIHYRLPWPVDAVTRVPVHKVQRIHITDFGTTAAAATAPPGAAWTSEASFPPGFRAGYAVTGDNNLVNLDCIIQYHVSDPARYLFRFSDGQAERLLSDAGCSTIIHCIASRPVDMILTTGKREIEMEVKKRLQEALDETGSGLDIAFVELKKVKAPSQVKKYFDDVINASIDKNKTISLAQSYRNEQLPAARGRAVRLQEDAEAYKNKTVSEAEGNTKRFLDLFGEYEKSKNITRRRLLIDTMRDVFSRLKKVYVVAPRKGEPAKLKIFKK